MGNEEHIPFRAVSNVLVAAVPYLRRGEVWCSHHRPRRCQKPPRSGAPPSRPRLPSALIREPYHSWFMCNVSLCRCVAVSKCLYASRRGFRQGFRRVFSHKDQEEKQLDLKTNILLRCKTLCYFGRSLGNKRSTDNILSNTSGLLYY